MYVVNVYHLVVFQFCATVAKMQILCNVGDQQDGRIYSTVVIMGPKSRFTI